MISPTGRAGRLNDEQERMVGTPSLIQWQRIGGGTLPLATGAAPDSERVGVRRGTAHENTR